MLYYIRYDQFKWVSKERDPRDNDLYVAFYLEFPQYGLKYYAGKLKEGSYHTYKSLNSCEWEII